MKKIIVFSLVLLVACVPATPQVMNVEQAAPVMQIQATNTPLVIHAEPGDQVLIIVDPILPATNVPDTPVPSTAPPTATAPSTGAEPNVNAPFCTDIGLEHDPDAWHAHWNADAGCFWHGFHGDDPNSPEMVSAFGVWEYPHFRHEHESSPEEHTIKHRGDVVFAAYEGDPNWVPCPSQYNVVLGYNQSGDSVCIKSYRIVTHAADEAGDFLFVNHSFSVEYLACTKSSNYTDCGIIRSKGLAYYENFRVPFYTPRDLRPGCDADTQDCDFGFGYEFSYPADVEGPAPNDEPYVQTQRDVLDMFGGTPVLEFLRQRVVTNKISWSMNESNPCGPLDTDKGCRNGVVRFAFQAFDVGFLTDNSNLNNITNICFGEEHCLYDNSYKGVFEVGLNVNPEWDMIDGVQDGRIDGVLWVDRYQQEVDQSQCTQEGFGDTLDGDCFELEFEDFPITNGIHQKRGPGNLTYYLTEYNQCEPNYDCKVR